MQLHPCRGLDLKTARSFDLHSSTISHSPQASSSTLKQPQSQCDYHLLPGAIILKPIKHVAAHAHRPTSNAQCPPRSLIHHHGHPSPAHQHLPFRRLPVFSHLLPRRIEDPLRSPYSRPRPRLLRPRAPTWRARCRLPHHQHKFTAARRVRAGTVPFDHAAGRLEIGHGRQRGR